MGVTFLATHSKRGNVRAIGPVTGLVYEITPYGTPVNDLDVPKLLEVTGPPCCGEQLPFGGQVKLFGKTAGSTRQFATVPDSVLNAGPMKKATVKLKEEKPKSVEKEDKVEVNDAPFTIGVSVSESKIVEDNQEE